MTWLTAELRLDWIAVAIVLGFGGAAAWFDWTSGRIPNQLLKWFFLAVVLWLWVLLVVAGFMHRAPYLLLPQATVPGFLRTVAQNTLIAFGVGLALWFGRLWAAGDAKLFPLIVAALPLRFYSQHYVELWPAFVLFFNVVMASLLIVLADLVWRAFGYLGARYLWARSEAPPPPKHPLWLRAWRGVRRNGGAWGRLLLLFFFILVFIKVVRHILSQIIGLAVALDPTILYVILFFACHPLIRLMQRYRFLLIAAAIIDVALVLLALFTDWIPGLTLRLLVGMSFIAIALIVFRLLYDSYQQRVDFRLVDADGLRAKMILAEEHQYELRRDKAYFKGQQLELGPLLPDGLKPDQVSLVQRWWRERLPGQAVKIQKTFPMGPTFLIGVLLTLLLQDYVVRLPR